MYIIIKQIQLKFSFLAITFSIKSSVIIFGLSKIFVHENKILSSKMKELSLVKRVKPIKSRPGKILVETEMRDFPV